VLNCYHNINSIPVIHFQCQIFTCDMIKLQPSYARNSELCISMAAHFHSIVGVNVSHFQSQRGLCLVP